MSTPVPAIQIDHLPYVPRLQARDPADIDLVVIHCTELPDMAMAREYGKRVLYPEAGTGASGHWYVDRDGGITEYVPAERVAHHVRGWNPRSVGIELVNTGRYPHWYDSRHQAMTEPYTGGQIAALLALLAQLRATLPGLRLIAGHEDLDTDRVAASDDPARNVARKVDPGPLFPWSSVLAACGLERLLPASS
ncbi:N-acetylmuramoyl-L-alanine amidase [Luteimonas yindakuii]|uniref:N-acetylmuramoyl-L-alanine amidase n=1 Tax=Luteimonas yindakuii TaxID=2565782 RepID=UPI0010A49E5E|nr:N-acetylmuramoyl-L-alanine amidase [Luteimonas yindakuii]QCO67974.1 N-acetylmuramoyl-L-alanine amidase [Luteimonas yindakuii]